MRSSTQPTSHALDGALDRDRLVQLVCASVRIRSYSGDELEISEFMADHLAGLDLEVEVQSLGARRRNVIARWRGCGAGESLMYNGHMDTNPSGQGWRRDPLAGDSDEEFVYGIGVCNMKAANASFLHAVEMLKKAGFQPAGDLIVALVVGELQGGVGTVHMLDNGVRADHFIVGEPTELTLLTRHSASFVFEITLHGRTRHLSKRSEGVDAIRKMEALLPRLRALRFSGRRTASERALDRIHVGVLRAGVSEEMLDWRPQQLADVCVARCAGRFGPSLTLEAAMADIQALLDDMAAADPEFQAELRLVENNRIFMPPFSVGHRTAPVQALARAHRAVTGAAAKIGAHTPAKFFGSDAAHLASAGMTGVLYGPGGTYNTMPDERVATDEIITAARVYARTVVDLLSGTA